jgi:shikimate dehydrogenase
MTALRRAAVIGHPVAHSRSPALFARFAAASGIALAYDAVDVAPDELAATLARWREQADFVGCNVTLPHKERALALADRVEPAAQACGAANVLTRDGGALVADNTDVTAVEAALAQYGVALHGARVAVLGAGGAARAVAEAARRSGAASIVVAARDPVRAAAVAADFGATACALDGVPVSDVYVNATPVGMQGQPQRSLLPPDAPRGAAAFDLVYVPEETPFLIDARARGLRAVPGTAMFLAQAAATFEKWFGFAPRVPEGEAGWRVLRQAQDDNKRGQDDNGQGQDDNGQAQDDSDVSVTAR